MLLAPMCSPTFFKYLIAFIICGSSIKLCILSRMASVEAILSIEEESSNVSFRRISTQSADASTLPLSIPRVVNSRSTSFSFRLSSLLSFSSWNAALSLDMEKKTESINDPMHKLVSSFMILLFRPKEGTTILFLQTISLQFSGLGKIPTLSIFSWKTFFKTSSLDIPTNPFGVVQYFKLLVLIEVERFLQFSLDGSCKSTPRQRSTFDTQHCTSVPTVTRFRALEMWPLPFDVESKISSLPLSRNVKVLLSNEAC
mmetsp:Transcript_11690/g.17720  ORF Transcript_11690/g.17720 Transcript_11690/m.17720 type:complete len:256 (-) Transcript_11690:862-1629(-)